MFFDVGVYLVVIGLVLDILRSLGAEVDRQEQTERAEAAGRPGGGAGVSPNLLLVIVVGVLFAAGVTLLLERSLTRVILGVILLGNGVNLLILLGGGYGGPPIVGVTARAEMSDPLPQAMILTAIVITLGHDRVPAGDGVPQLAADRPRRGAGRRRGPADHAARRTRPGPGDPRTPRTPSRVGPRTAVPTTGHRDDLARAAAGGDAAARRGADPAVIRRHPNVQRAVSLLVLSATLAVAVALLVLTTTGGPLVVAVGGWAAPLGIVLVADQLAALMLVVSAAVTLCVLVYSIGQGMADGDDDTPVSVYHPTYLVLTAGVTNAFLAGDLFNLYVGFEILLAASYVLITLGGTEGRIRDGTTYVVVSLLSSLIFLAAHRPDLRRHRHAEPGPAGRPPRRAARRPAAGAAEHAAARLRHQGGGLPAVGLAAGQLSDRHRAGHRRLRRPAHQGRRLRDHPHPDAAVPRRPRRPTSSWWRPC